MNKSASGVNAGATMYYRVFGLTFGSDCELPGLDRLEETSAVDYSLKFDDKTNSFELLRNEFHSPGYISPRRVKCGRTVVEVRKTEDRRKFLFRFYDDVEFIIDRGRQDIWIDGLGRASLQAAIHHLLFSLPGFLLVLRNSACLPGAAIGWGDAAIALLGNSISGKSALSAYMAARGMDVLSDDLVALDVIGSIITVYPGYPWICLRPGSLDWLRTEMFVAGRFGSKWHYLDEAYVTWDLRRMGSPFQLKPRKLEAFYLLVPVDDPKCKPGIEQVPRHQALMVLMEAASRTHIPYPELMPQEFSLMGSAAAAVPTYRLRYHLSADGLTALSALLVQLLRVRSAPREKVEA
jgi:hypothetical protein